jgi:hypothetical protein
MKTNKTIKRFEDIRFLRLSDAQILKIESEVKMMLHAARDCMRNQGKYDTKEVTFDVTDGYYGEAFGVMRGLQVLGYGEFQSSNIPHPISRRWNLRWWFAQLEQAVLDEENFKTTHECAHCFDKWGHDDARPHNTDAARRKRSLI